MTKKLFPYIKGFEKDAVKAPLFILIEAVCELFLPLLMAAVTLRETMDGLTGLSGDVGHSVLLSPRLVRRRARLRAVSRAWRAHCGRICFYGH